MKKLLFISILFFATFAKSQSLETAYNLAQNDTFQTRVKMATLKASNDILSGADRTQWLINYAQLIVTSPTGNGWINAVSFGVTTNVAISRESSDGDIQFTVNSIFNKYAKAYYRIVDDGKNSLMKEVNKP